MSGTLTLHGYRYSVYSRIARIVLHLKGAEYRWVEVDPFTNPDPAYLQIHPFNRVPALVHGDFTLIETAAITRYLDDVLDGPALQPETAQDRARMAQVIAMIDSYGYWPMVRQVFSHSVFRPLVSQPPCPDTIAEGLAAARPVLAALDAVAEERRVLNGKAVTLADCHLAPMLDYFTRADTGRDALAGYPALSAWWHGMAQHPVMTATDPGLAALAR